MKLKQQYQTLIENIKLIGKAAIKEYVEYGLDAKQVYELRKGITRTSLSELEAKLI